MRYQHALYHLIIVFCSVSLLPDRAAAEERPLTGTAVAEFAPLDQAILHYMDRIHCQAASVAVSYEGKLLYSRGYGWRDADRKVATPPDILMRIASVTKPITAAEIKKLIREKKLTGDTKVFPLLGIKPYNGKEGDRRLNSITIEQLLEHKGGWDRDKSYDPMFIMAEIEKALKLKKSPTPAQVIEYMLAQPLQFAPGERSSYSNFGYCILGRVIEHITGKSYEEAIARDILGPAGIQVGRGKDLTLGHSSSKMRDPNEVWYPINDDSFSLEVMDAHGGWIASAPAMCKFLDAYWINGEPRKGSDGSNWTFFGSLPGTSSMARQRPDGVNVVVLVNSRRDGENDDLDFLSRTVDAAIDQWRGQARFAAIWEKQNGPAWGARHNLTGAEYQKEFDKFAKDGFRPTCLSSYAMGGEPRYAAIWEKREGPEWTARHGLNRDDFEKTIEQLKKEGFRPVWVTACSVGGEAQYSAIWEKRKGKEWAIRFGLSADDYQKAFDKYGKEGLRLTCVDVYEVRGEFRYAATWEKRESPEWTARHNMTVDDYQKAFDELGGKGFRLVDVSGCHSGGESRYAAIWEKRDGPEWVARHALNSDDYQKTVDKLAKDGFRPVIVSATGSGKNR